MPEPETVTMKQMCETIERSAILRRPDGTVPTAEETYQYSPKGELSAIFSWYQSARIRLGMGPSPLPTREEREKTGVHMGDLARDPDGTTYIWTGSSWLTPKSSE